MEVWGISGKAGCGKDYIYNNFLRPAGFYRWALADHFKVWIVGKGEATHEEVFRTKPPHIRHLLQQEGTERGRLVYGENVWVKTAFEWMTLLSETWGIQRFVISDVRFPNEMTAVQEFGGKVLRIVAPQREANSSLSPEARQHISETALDSTPMAAYDVVIYNDPGQDAREQVLALLGESAITL